jgi:hypothetical protein
MKKKNTHKYQHNKLSKTRKKLRKRKRGGTLPNLPTRVARSTRKNPTKKPWNNTSTKSLQWRDIPEFVVNENSIIFIVTSEKDVWKEWRAENYPMTIYDSPMGCGYNVLVMLQLMDRSTAFNLMLDTMNRETGLPLIDISKIITNNISNNTNNFFKIIKKLDLYVKPYIFTTISPNDAIDDIKRELDGAIIKNTFLTRFEFNYVIIKLMITEQLGHTIVISYNKSTNVCHILDPQRMKMYEMTKFREYMGKTQSYLGISCLFCTFGQVFKKENPSTIFIGGTIENNTDKMIDFLELKHEWTEDESNLLANAYEDMSMNLPSLDDYLY